ncbi:MAG: aminotransferase class I/II-fold pyridoxal phosphate-dependent enzyme [Phycisphaerae bacterium]|nr:aminotransferase class I/II-fold pyridoxal phosphate-dependent enzyme [Phycisphaerae bacterium]
MSSNVPFPSLAFDTRAVHGWGEPDLTTGSVVTPIVQSATYEQQAPGLPTGAHTYSRASNPTVAALERCLGALEDAPPAVAFASGVAATHALALALLKSGDHAVISATCYGGTVRLFRETLAGLGIRSTFVDASDVSAVAAALEPRTRLLLVETPANPTLALCDIAALARLAGAARVCFAVDNTFLTAALQRPLDLGADISLLSTTKWIEGHNATIGGALVARDASLLERLRHIRKSVGSIQAPFNAWLTLQGVKTLSLRLERHSRSAQCIAEAIDGHPSIRRLLYPGLASFPQRALAQQQHRQLHGGVIAIELEGGIEAATLFAASLRIITLAESLGAVESLLTHPVTMTHGDVPDAQRRAAGITPGLVRLSVGLEDPADLLRDLLGGLEAVSAKRAVDREEVCSGR